MRFLCEKEVEEKGGEKEKLQEEKKKKQQTFLGLKLVDAAARCIKRFNVSL